MTRLPMFVACLLVLTLASIAPEAAAGPRSVNNCRTISNPGSYILTRNLNGTTAVGDCIVIASSHVTLDLDGFGIGGPGVIGGVPAGHGINVACCDHLNVAVRNGSVTGWVSGVVFHFTGEGAVVERIRSYDNDVGINVNSEGALIRDNVAQGNTVNGIAFRAGSTVLGNVANNNGNDGIDGFCDSTIMFNTATGNTGNNMVIAAQNPACVIEHNTAP